MRDARREARGCVCPQETGEGGDEKGKKKGKRALTAPYVPFVFSLSFVSTSSLLPDRVHPPSQSCPLSSSLAHRLPSSLPSSAAPMRFPPHVSLSPARPLFFPLFTPHTFSFCFVFTHTRYPPPLSCLTCSGGPQHRSPQSGRWRCGARRRARGAGRGGWRRSGRGRRLRVRRRRCRPRRGGTRRPT